MLKQQYQTSLGLPFAQVLSESHIAQVLDEHQVSLYTPMVVLWAWNSQVIDADKSLSHAVKRVTTWMALAGEAVPSADTGAIVKHANGCPGRFFQLC